MLAITCDPQLNEMIVRTLRGQEASSNAFVCLYAAQRIEDLEAEAADVRERFLTADKTCAWARGEIENLKSEAKAGAKLCADRQDRVNDLEHVLFLAFNALKHVKSENDSGSSEAKVAGNMKTLLDETVARIERFYEGREAGDGGEKPA